MIILFSFPFIKQFEKKNFDLRPFSFLEFTSQEISFGLNLQKQCYTTAGYRRISEACKKGNYPMPSWEEIGMVVRVTLYPYTPFLSQGPASLSLRQQKIRSLLEEKRSLTAKELHAQLQDISERALRADLLELKKRGLIVKEGKGRSSFWSILPNSA